MAASRPNAVRQADAPSAFAPDVSVAALLAQSRQHQKSRTHAANRLQNTQHTPDYAESTRQAQMALDAREEAHRRDPEHLDPAWALDPVPHEQICRFLQRYLES